jgi:hypothetical protein
MTKRKFVLLPLFALVLAVLVAGTAATTTGSAEDSQDLTLHAVLAVTGFGSIDSNPVTGWTRITDEQLAGQVVFVDGPSEFAGAGIVATQSSVEQFDSADFSVARALNGVSGGEFTLIGAGGPITTGSYGMHVSNNESCQVLGTGGWRVNDGTYSGSGAINVCTNWDTNFGTFIAQVSITGEISVSD